MEANANAITPQAPEGFEIRYHELTPLQIETIKPLLDQIERAQQMVGYFLGYVQREAKLPESPAGWQLAQQPGSGAPCLRGVVKKD